MPDALNPQLGWSNNENRLGDCCGTTCAIVLMMRFNIRCCDIRQCGRQWLE
jgi:hypothetical protein